MLNSYILIQMGDKTLSETLQWIILTSGIGSHDIGVLLLDLIQRFRTVDLDNKLIRLYSPFNDIWLLLSDGKFTYDTKIKDNILWTIKLIIADFLLFLMNKFEKRKSKSKLNKSDTSPKDRSKLPTKYCITPWRAKSVQMMFKNKLTMQLIYDMKFDDIISKLWLLYLLQNVTLPSQYNKLLVIISGNIDLAYHFAEWVSLADTDPDIIYLYSKKINIIHIKDALMLRFKPLQIARFGNNQIIYTSLNSENYNKLIDKKLLLLVDKVYDKFNIKITFDKTVNLVIFKNGVFPTQGVRPLFSTLSMIILSNIPKFLLVALINNVNLIYIECVNSKLCSTINLQEISLSIWLVLELIRRKKNTCKDSKRSISVHLIGHALVYSLLFNIAPKQITINVTGQDLAGFVQLNEVSLCSKYIYLLITVCMAGYAALKLVFGNLYLSAGSLYDLQTATMYASKMIRYLAMSDTIAYTRSDGSPSTDQGAIKNQLLNLQILKILQTQTAIANNLIQLNLLLYIRLVLFVYDKTAITTQLYILFCKSVDPKYDFNKQELLIVYGYNKAWEKFILKVNN